MNLAQKLTEVASYSDERAEEAATSLQNRRNGEQWYVPTSYEVMGSKLKPAAPITEVVKPIYPPYKLAKPPRTQRVNPLFGASPAFHDDVLEHIERHSD